MIPAIFESKDLCHCRSSFCVISFTCSTWKSDNEEVEFLASTKLAKYQEVSECFHGELWVISVWVICLRVFFFFF